MYPIIRKEFRDAFRNRWVAGYAILLAVLGVFAAWVGMRSSGGMAFQMFGRTTATITNLALLLAPLVAALLGANSIASEREKGTLERLLAQPITPAQLISGKFLGLVAAISAATVAAFAPAGILVGVIAPASLPLFLVFPLVVIPVSAAMIGLGMLTSAGSASGARAIGNAVVLWFSMVLFYDLVLMGTLMVVALPTGALVTFQIANPVDAARTLIILLLEPDLHILGPAGALMVTKLGRWGAAGTIVASLLVWSSLPMLFARRAFHRTVCGGTVTKDADTARDEYLFEEASAGTSIR